MKKIIAIAMALVMCLGIMSMVAFAANDEMTVEVVVPADWTDCYVYGWTDMGEVFGTWPGTKVTDGSFKLDSPVDGLVINEGLDKRQSVDIMDLVYTAGATATIFVGESGSDGKYTVEIKPGVPAPTSSAPVPTTYIPLETRTLTIQVPRFWEEVYLYTWEPEDFGVYPGTKLEKDGNTCKIQIKVTEMNLVVTGKLADGTQQQTGDIELRAGTDNVTIDLKNLVPSNTRPLTIQVPSSWEQVYIYTRDPESLGAFPGTELTKSGNVCQTRIKSTMSNLVIVGRKADTTLQQTADIPLPNGDDDVEIQVFEDGTYRIKKDIIDRFVVTNEPAATKTDGTPSAYRVTGAGVTDANGKELYNGAWLGNWQPNWEGGVMYEVEPGLYRKNFKNVQPGRYAFKITKDGKWDVSYGDGENGDQDCVFEVVSAGDITVDFKIEDGIGYIKLYGRCFGRYPDEEIPGEENPKDGDISMLSVVVLMALASVTAGVLVVNKKKFL